MRRKAPTRRTVDPPVLQSVAGKFAFPNGMVVTPDNETLIVSESFTGSLPALDIAGDGGLSRRRMWAQGLGPDGICLDATGATWTSGQTTRACGSPKVARSSSASSSIARVSPPRSGGTRGVAHSS